MVKGNLLSGIRVLEVGEGRVGPGAALMLADLGAEVIKVESTTRLDMTRTSASSKPVPGARYWNCCPSYNIRNHGKYGITLDLTNPKGLEAFMRLAKVCDIFLSNTAAGVTEKLGIAYEDLVKINPTMIYLSSTGYGRTGPYAERVAMGNSIDAAAGLFGLRDYGDGDATKVSPDTHCDSIAAVTNAFAIVTAIYYRQRTGRGTYIDVSMVEPSVTHIGEAIIDYSMNRRIWHSLGNRDATMAPQGCYRCRGKDEWVTLSITSDAEWARFAAIIGKPELANDKRFDSVVNRLKAQDELDAIISAWTIDRSKREVMELLQRSGIAAGMVADHADVFNDPHVRQRQLLTVIEDPDAGTHNYPGRLWQLTETDVPPRQHAPTLGEYNHYVLREIAGYSMAEIEAMAREGIIGDAPVAAEKRAAA